MKATIRPASYEDLDDLERLVRPPVGRTNLDDLAEQQTGKLTFLTAWVNDELLGWGLICWGGPRSAEVAKHFPDCPEIYRLTVRNAYRSMGIGSQLIHYSEELARRLSKHAIGLGVAVENTRAMALYQRLGYQDSGIGEYIDTYRSRSRFWITRTIKDRVIFMRKSPL